MPRLLVPHTGHACWVLVGFVVVVVVIMVVVVVGSARNNRYDVAPIANQVFPHVVLNKLHRPLSKYVIALHSELAMHIA